MTQQNEGSAPQGVDPSLSRPFSADYDAKGWSPRLQDPDLSTLVYVENFDDPRGADLKWLTVHLIRHEARGPYRVRLSWRIVGNVSGPMETRLYAGGPGTLITKIAVDAWRLYSLKIEVLRYHDLRRQADEVEIQGIRT